MADRTCEKLVEDGWVEIPMEDIKAGDVFRLTEPDGQPVVSGKGERMLHAVCDAEPQPGGKCVVQSVWIPLEVRKREHFGASGEDGEAD